MENIRKKIGLTLAVAAVIIIILIWVYVRLIKPDQIKVAILPINTVRVTHPTATSWQQPINVVGTISSNSNVTVAAETNGRVIEINYKPDTFVKQGAPLFQIFNADLKAQLAVAQANLRSSQQNFERITQLYKTGFASTADLDNAKQTYESDLSTVKQNEALLSQTIVKSPVDGKVGLNTVNVGDYVASGSPLTYISSVAPLRVDFAIPGRYQQDVSQGMKVYFSNENDATQMIPATIVAIDAAVNENNRNLNVRAALDKDMNLKAGQYVNVLLYVGKQEPVFVLPETAIHYELGRAFVYKIENNQATQVPVTVLQMRNNTIGVQGSLAAEDIIISVSPPSLHQGDSVHIAKDA